LGVETIREVVEAPFRVVYRITGRYVEIITVFEGHRRFPAERLRPARKKRRVAT